MANSPSVPNEIENTAPKSMASAIARINTNPDTNEMNVPVVDPIVRIPRRATTAPVAQDAAASAAKIAPSRVSDTVGAVLRQWVNGNCGGEQKYRACRLLSGRLSSTRTRNANGLTMSPSDMLWSGGKSMRTSTDRRPSRALQRAAARGVDRVLISERRLRRRVRELGSQLSRDYAGSEIVCVGALNGVICFLSDLLRDMDLMTSIDLIDVHRSVADGTHQVKLDDNPFHLSIEGRHVLIVEDIVDTGLTLREIVAAVRRQKPASQRVCALLDKPAHRQVEVALDYVGFEIPPHFVVGYGLDYEHRYRNLPFVGIVEDADWLPAMLKQAPSG